jgi:hypothetical protein
MLALAALRCGWGKKRGIRQIRRIPIIPINPLLEDLDRYF